MKLIDRLKIAVKNSSWNSYIQSFLRGEDVTVYESMVGADAAMKYSAVFACSRVLSETLASLPIMVYKKDQNGDREIVSSSKIYDILHNSPNQEMNSFNFKEFCMMNLNLGGNAVCEKLVNKSGDVIGLYPYSWQQVTIERNRESNQLTYKIKIGNTEKILTRSQVFHITGFSIDGIIGISPIEYAANAIRLGLSHQSFENGFYRNGAHSSGAFKHPGHLNEESYQRLKKSIDENWTGSHNTGRPMLLEDGMDFVQFSVKPVDAQLIESKKFSIEDICRIYRVPLHLVQNLDRATNNNIEHQSLEFVMYTMMPWFKRWEDAINQQLLSESERRQGYYCEFKVDSLLRGDLKSRYEAYGQGRQWGWLSVNDIRKLENLNSIPNGDIYLQPINMVEAGEEEEDDVEEVLDDPMQEGPAVNR